MVLIRNCPCPNSPIANLDDVPEDQMGPGKPYFDVHYDLRFHPNSLECDHRQRGRWK